MVFLSKTSWNDRGLCYIELKVLCWVCFAGYQLIPLQLAHKGTFTCFDVFFNFLWFERGIDLFVSPVKYR